MSQITDLRKNGRLDEAYKLAKDALVRNFDNLWNKRDMSWVCYSYIKQAYEQNDEQQFLRYVKEISELGLPNNEIMLSENLAIIIGQWIHKYISPIQNISIKEQKIDDLSQLILQIPFCSPNEKFSFLISLLHKSSKSNIKLYYKIFSRIGLDFFTNEDYKSFNLNGKTIMSLAEQVYIAYSKTLETLSSDREDNVKEEALTKIDQFLPYLDRIIVNHPEYQYPLYYKAKLLLIKERYNEVISCIIPFVKKKPNDFWTWQLLGDAHLESDKEMALSCYSRALLCSSAKEEMIVKIRENIANIMSMFGFFNEAKYEYEQAAQTRQDKWGKTSSSYRLVSSEEWFINAVATKNNKNFYLEHASLAENLLYADEMENILITAVNEKKHMANFMKENESLGFFNYDKIIKWPKKNRVYKVVFKSYNSTGISRISIARLVPEPENTVFFRKCAGIIKVNPAQSFAFVDNIFFSPDFVKKHNLVNGQYIKGIAVKSYNPKKQVCSWSIYRIEE